MQKSYYAINREVMFDTYELCKTNEILKEAINYTIKNQKVILEEDHVIITHEGKPSKMFVSSKRTFEAASYYKGKKVAVLNFANNRNIGGSPYSASAQEEALCRCSTLLPCIQACEESFYIPHRHAILQGKMDKYGNDDIIYSPDVVVFKTDTLEPELLPKEEWFKVDVITSAAPEAYGSYDEDKLYRALKSRIIRILDVSLENNVEVLILGAFGCGAFGNPPKMVAELFYGLLKRYNFEVVEFAVYTRNDATNYDVFKEIIEKPYKEEKSIKFVYVMKNGIMMRVPEEVAKTMDCDKPKSVRKINVSNKV